MKKRGFWKKAVAFGLAIALLCGEIPAGTYAGEISDGAGAYAESTESESIEAEKAEGTKVQEETEAVTGDTQEAATEEEPEAETDVKPADIEETEAVTGDGQESTQTEAVTDDGQESTQTEEVIEPQTQAAEEAFWAATETEEADGTEDTEEEVETYTITYELNGGKNHKDNPASYTTDSAAIELNAPTKKGYTFDGWYSDAAFTKKVSKIAKGSTGNLTFYAKWTANTYTIAFDGNGATGGSTKAMTNRKYAKSYTLKANGFTRTNYVFTGWNTKANGSGTSYTDGQSVKNLSAKANGKVTLYAQWKRIQYTIKFYGNKSTSGKTASISCKAGKSYTLTANGFKRTGYTFAGWNTKADGTGKSYTDKQSVKNLTKTDGGTVKLYAQWTKKKYSIKYELNGGTNDKKNPSSYTVTSEVTFKEPTRKGYTFKGWYEDANFTKKITKISKGSTGKITLYAKWSINKYKIKFKANGGKGSMNTISATYGKTYQLPLCGFVREGYYCTGFNTKADGTGTTYKTLQSVKNLSSKSGGTVTLYAMWSKLNETELSMAKDVVTLVNKERKAQNLGSLETNSLLSAIAQQRAKEIAEEFSHTRPDLKSSCFTLYGTAGYSYMAAGENIAYGYTSAKNVMAAWMDSSGHRANILNSNYKKIGVGCYYANGRYYWVQNFSD